MNVTMETGDGNGRKTVIDSCRNMRYNVGRHGTNLPDKAGHTILQSFARYSADSTLAGKRRKHEYSTNKGGMFYHDYRLWIRVKENGNFWNEGPPGVLEAGHKNYSPGGHCV